MTELRASGIGFVAPEFASRAAIVEHRHEPNTPPLDPASAAKKAGYEAQEAGAALYDVPLEYVDLVVPWQAGWMLAERIALRLHHLRASQMRDNPESAGVTHTAQMINGGKR